MIARVRGRFGICIFLFLIIFTNQLDINNLDCKTIVVKFKDYSCVNNKVFGRGATGVAFEVQKQNQHFILKVQESKGNNSVENKRDLFILTKLKDIKGVIQLKEYKFEDDFLFEIIEFGDRGDLKKNILKDSYFNDQKNILKFFKQTVETIQRIHDAGFVHADLKPENIVVKNDYSPRIIDFDLSTKMNEFKGGRGTLGYMDPIILEYWGIRQIKYTPMIDVYSLGVILFEMLTKKIPFHHGGSRSLLNDNIALGTYSLPKNILNVLAILIEGCLQKDNSKRLNTEDILNILHLAEIKNKYMMQYTTEDLTLTNIKFHFEFNQNMNSQNKSNVKKENKNNYPKNNTFIVYIIILLILFVFSFGLLLYFTIRDEIKNLKKNIDEKNLEIKLGNEE
jgi:serine/threonine protein kinase